VKFPSKEFIPSSLIKTKAVKLTKEPSFEAVLNMACERLWDKQIRYSIRRIMEMDGELERLEKELDEFLGF
jgi:hypothetical protein